VGELLPQYVAFLRGINVGGHRVKMDHLRGLFEQLDVRDVSTFIASGNVLFSSRAREPTLRQRIEGHLADRLGYQVATFLRTRAEIDGIVSRGDGDRDVPPGPGTLHVALLYAPAPPALCETLGDLSSKVDQFGFAGREIYWRTRGKVSESPLFGAGLERALRGTENTMRNMNTLERLAARLAEASGA
jgi:uncharacterized protein (DUF1697 family)